jgi:hypothetical protein
MHAWPVGFNSFGNHIERYGYPGAGALKWHSAVPEIGREQGEAPHPGLDQPINDLAVTKLEVCFAHLQPAGMGTLLRRHFGDIDIEGRTDPSLGVEVVGVEPAAGQPDGPRTREIEVPGLACKERMARIIGHVGNELRNRLSQLCHELLQDRRRVLEQRAKGLRAAPQGLVCRMRARGMQAFQERLQVQAEALDMSG